MSEQILETKRCPSCGVENPFTRVTCQVCHAKMSGKVNPMSDENPKTDPPKTVGNVGPDVKPKKVKKASKPKKDIKSPVPPPIPTKEPAIRKKRVVRRKRRKSNSIPTLFSLSDGKLHAVNITPFVLKPLKRKELDSESRSLLSVWNRNKDLFQK